ncbi:MAG TPA: nuclear transport factor 2 family protein [Pyrinomonadaceae bacterium]|nr:nuclear transport factor 2 family protein [Pyrinomonadaceae bacterium]
MKCFPAVVLILLASIAVAAQDYSRQIYDTERAFEKAVAEKGIKEGFIEFLSPVGVLFRPGPVNGRESWKARSATPAALTWNPIKIEVSANGAIGYSIGNSIFKPKGKDDTNEIHGHYLSVWARQPNGEYRAALDTGVSHEKPVAAEPGWKPVPTPPEELNDKKTFAGDSSVGFFEMTDNRGAAKAYKLYAAEDIYLFRDGKAPFVGRDAALGYLNDQKLPVKFQKRKSFIEAGDLAYVYSGYTLTDKNGVEKEKGNFVQVWKLRNGRWQIAADVFIPLPPAGN